MKKLTFKLLSIIMVSFLVVGVLNYIVDPLQFYRKANFYNPYYYNQTRYQNPAIARTHKYDSIILGTSMAENFSTSQIKNVLKMNAVNLAIEGSSCYEQSLLLNIAQNKTTLKNVIWSLDYCSFNSTPNSVRDETAKFPYYLYDQNIFNDYKYLFNSNTINRILETFTYNAFKVGNERLANIEKRMYWFDFYEYKEERVLQAWNDYGSKINPNNNEYKWENIKSNIDYNIIPFIKQNPNTNFYFYHAPYSILQYQFFLNNGYLENLIKFKSYLFKETTNFDNVYIYDMQMDFNLISNLNNYKDLAHHSKDINDYIIECIHNGNFKTNKNNLDINNQKLLKFVKECKPIILKD